LARAREIDVGLDELNNTELVTLCHWVGIPASRAYPRELLLHMLEELEPVPLDNPIQPDREALQKFLQMHWPRYQMMAEKKVCPRCDECRDIQITLCYLRNRHHLKGR
jgi:hypothetical protein